MNINASTRLTHLLGTLLLAFFSLGVEAKSALVVTYRANMDPHSTNTYINYYTELVRLALEKTRADFGDYQLQTVANETTELRTRADLIQNKYPNYIVELAYEDSLTQSGELTFINIPIDGGIVGYRVCFVNPGIKAQLNASTSLNDLRQYTIGQGIGWADTSILRANGFKVVEVGDFNNIAKMVAAGRVDLYCRGANQLQVETEEFKSIEHLTYDETFVLAYPLPRFFYFNRQSQEAKQRIEAGLQRAYKDGSMRALWQQHYAAKVSFANLGKRKIWRLENPLIQNLAPGFERYFIDPIHPL